MTQKINLTPQCVDLALYAGDGAELKVTVKSPEGLAVPLLGSVLAQIRNERIDASPLTSFTTDLAEASKGIVRLALSGAATSGLLTSEDPFKGYWDVQWTESGKEPLTLVQGKVTCTRDVTR